MSQSLVQIYLHLVFSTKNRRPYLTDRTLQEKVYGYMSGICKNLGCIALKIGGVEDHAHLLTRHSKTVAFSVSPAHVKDVKKYITHQETHHRKESFQDEFRRLCKRYGIEIDERYVWE